jgi:hypothetical protein
MQDPPFTQDKDYDNGYIITWSNAADTASIPGIGVDAANNLLIGADVYNPMKLSVDYNMGANASIGDTAFFVAPAALAVTGISYVHKTAATDAGAVSVNITKDSGSQLPGNGVTTQLGTFNAKGAANVVQNATLSATNVDATGVPAAANLKAGDRLSVNFTGVLTSLAGVVATVYMRPLAVGGQQTLSYYAHANADITTTTFVEANRSMTINKVQIWYGTKFSAGTTINVTKDTGTQAPGAGTTILAAAVPGDGTAATTLTPALSTTPGYLTMAAGDRLAVTFSATTGGADVLVSVTFNAIAGRKEVMWWLGPTPNQQVAQNIFCADRDYQILDVSTIFGTAAGGVATLGVEICRGSIAPGAGQIAVTENSNTGANVNLTANTVQISTLGSLRNTTLYAGDRLSLQPTGAAGTLAKVCVAISLAPR